MEMEAVPILYRSSTKTYHSEQEEYTTCTGQRSSSCPIRYSAWMKHWADCSKEIEKTWEQDIPGFITKADEQWPTLER